HDCAVVRSLYARQVLGRILVRTGVVVRVLEQVSHVGRAVFVDVRREGPLDRVLDVFARDRRAVLELQTGAELVGPGLLVRRWRTKFCARSGMICGFWPGVS